MKTTYAKIYKSGNGQTISLKKNILQQVGLKVGDDIEVKVKSGQIVLTKPNSFKEKWRAFVESGGKYDQNEYDWVQPVGRELW
ncbi:AbrB family transcriptional regulator [Staphylococcus warneri]|jgi:antitoxin MazE|uniref:AbrB/MazE/SpoVT family DNA-binding domain-containing protein n=1 Tax=Staphylococcus warneri TaxID=1292 RepID=UPI000F5C81F1|nr:MULTISPECIES: AbrB family transcriptional regulator [Staphylococcus]MCM3484046.1 AbrB family transcriptional regulator [Staphylococcus warneri]MCR4502132.1 AbrB family transcriptional regulator [Staphylococcus warneri]MCT1634051.1 AbrB family transcriptional regulator [Staphylococcus warneri]MCT2350074.1 AbrB family transcriptional regulator [Staphylococcus warneri]MDK8581618.1 AbrB family transcriptional regulator [Staphylococcus aureus]